MIEPTQLSLVIWDGVPDSEKAAVALAAVAWLIEEQRLQIAHTDTLKLCHKFDINGENVVVEV